MSALIDFGSYEWYDGERLSETGMPLYLIGRSGVQFREASRKAASGAIQEATSTFPELKEYGWPDRGSKAEMHSLLLQASRFKRTEAPEGLEEACARLAARYPRSKPKPCLRSSNWVKCEIAEAAATECKSNVNHKASPGVPLSTFGTTNGAVINSHEQFICFAVAERLIELSKTDLSTSSLTPAELVRRGYCDPVRLFVKQEPHTNKKLSEKRYRLISSVSLVDQLVERLLFGPQNQLEIQRWRNIPSKPGMGLSLHEQAQSIWSELQTNHDIWPAAEADISGFDWSVQDWELWADVQMRCKLGGFENPVLKRAAVSRFYCFMNSVFQLSDGTLIEQGLPGLMKSGSYCTSSTNSRIRCLMAELIGAPWCIAMGDDSVEGYTADAAEKYAQLGHTCKDYIPCETTSEGYLKKVNFCSHELSQDSFWLTSWPKTLFRFLSTPNADIEDLRAELWGNPKWNSIERYVTGIRGGDKTKELTSRISLNKQDGEEGLSKPDEIEGVGRSDWFSVEETPEAGFWSAQSSSEDWRNGYGETSEGAHLCGRRLWPF